MNRDRFKDAIWAKNPQLLIIGGAGGIGSWLALLLSRIGHTIYIFDYDRYEELNMGGQFVNKDNVGMYKVEALQRQIMKYADTSINTFNIKYEEESVSTNFMFSAFDNMEARKIMFENWFEYNREHNNTDAIFIDGRLNLERFQIFCVTPKTTKLYREKYLFSDKDVADEACTLKQTSHTAVMIAGFMTTYFSNHIANLEIGQQTYKVPFATEYYAPLDMFSKNINT